MAISYPLSLPTVSGLARVSFQYRCVNSLVSSPWTGQQQVQETESDMWLADISLPVMDATEAGAYRAFLAGLRGQFGTFLLGDPVNTTPRGTVPGSPVVDGASQAGFSLATKGWTVSQTGILLEGDYLQIGSRLYMVIEDVDSDGSGEAVFDIRPRLRESPGDEDGITTSNCKGLFRLASQTVVILETAGDNLSYPITFGAIEAI